MKKFLLRAQITERKVKDSIIVFLAPSGEDTVFFHRYSQTIEKDASSLRNDPLGPWFSNFLVTRLFDTVKNY